MEIKSVKKSLFSIVIFLVLTVFLIQVSALFFANTPVSAQINDQGSGWLECRGWTDPAYRTKTTITTVNGRTIGGMLLCRDRALKRASNGNFYFPQMNPGLSLPPSGSKTATTPGTDAQWYNWGKTNTKEHFLSDDTSCALGPKVCIPTPTPTTKPSATPTTKPSATPTTKPSATPTTKPSSTPTTKPSATPTTKPSSTPTTKPSATPTVRPTRTPRPTKTVTPTPTKIVTPTPTTPVTVTPSVTVSVTPSITHTPVVTPTPGVEGDDTVFGFNLRKTVNGKLTYRVGELITFTVSLENSGTETITKVNMRDVYSTNMRVEAIYLIQNGQRRNVTSQFFANDSEMEGGNIMPRDPQNNDLLDLTDFTGDLNPGDKVNFEFIFKAVSKSEQVCNQAHASANSRSEISSQKVCVSVDAVVPVTD